MLNLLFLLALKIATTSELACVGSVQNMTIPMDLYVAGVEMEGQKTFATQGDVVYLNGPKAGALKPGTVQRVLRAEGKVRDPFTNTELGVYYRDIGTIQIEVVGQENATARVLSTCQGMLKGDLVIPYSAKPSMEFSGSLSNSLITLPQNGLVGTILLGKDDAREMAGGYFCFLSVGARDGVKAGDRFIVYRPYPPFNPQDMTTAGEGTNASYFRMANQGEMSVKLHDRSLPPQILGDVVIVEAGENVSTAKIINSMHEIHPGDLVVRK